MPQAASRSSLSEGEYDMIRSVLHCTMRDDSISVMPLNCDVQAKFSFMGNKIKVHLITMYGQKVEMPDSIEDSDDSTLMSRVRPIPLTDEEERIKEDYYKRNAKRPLRHCDHSRRTQETQLGQAHNVGHRRRQYPEQD